jgi:hypothetical protein
MHYIEHKPPEIGDILLCKSNSVFARAISASFRTKSNLEWASGSRPSNHNGIIGFNKDMHMCVFEAVSKGFVATPIIDYLADVDRDKCEIKIARFGITDSEQSEGNRWLQSQLGRKYDYHAYCSLIWRIALRLPPLFMIENPSSFYCSEAVSSFYRNLDHYILPKLCTPLHIESLIERGYLKIIAECVTCNY